MSSSANVAPRNRDTAGKGPHFIQTPWLNDEFFVRQGELLLMIVFLIFRFLESGQARAAPENPGY